MLTWVWSVCPTLANPRFYALCLTLTQKSPHTRSLLSTPYIGTVAYDDAAQVTVADIPGLVPGAHRNVGLGHAFLRHVERSRVLVFIVDVSRPEPWRDLQMLRDELDLYREGLSDRPSLVVCNKADAGDIARSNYDAWRLIAPDLKLVPVSAMLGKNIN